MAPGSDKPKDRKRKRNTNIETDFDSVGDKKKGANGDSTPPLSPSPGHTLSGKGGDSPHTPSKLTLAETRSEQSPLSNPSKYSGSTGQPFVNKFENYKPYVQPRNTQMFEAGSGVDVSLDVGGGEYVLKIKKRRISSSTDEDEVERTKQMAQSAGMLFLHADMLRDWGEQQLAQYRTSVQSIFIKSAP